MNRKSWHHLTELAGTIRTVISNQNKTWSVSLTWSKIFALIAPYLLEHPNDRTTKKIIGEQLYLISENPISGGTAELDDQIFQTIKIHLKSLGLVNQKYAKTTTGGAALFWHLTALGEEKLITLRSVKRNRSDHPETEGSVIATT